MGLIDTNVVIYAAGKVCFTRRSAKSTRPDCEGSLHANVDVELLQEILHVYAARKERAKGFDTIDDLLVLFPNPISKGREEIETARDLMHSNSFLGARDAIHAAVAQGVEYCACHTWTKPIHT